MWAAFNESKNLKILYNKIIKLNKLNKLINVKKKNSLELPNLWQKSTWKRIKI